MLGPNLGPNLGPSLDPNLGQKLSQPDRKQMLGSKLDQNLQEMEVRWKKQVTLAVNGCLVKSWAKIYRKQKLGKKR